jgi:ribosomal protein S18 acetylase RimI-like enzyme
VPQNSTAVMTRPLEDRDVEACAEIMLGIPLWKRYGATPKDAHALFARAARGTPRGRVAERGGRIAGFVVYTLRGTFDRSGYVRAVGVRPGEQGRGVGNLLMDAAEEEIFARGPNVFLLVSQTNGAARRFYERRGYREVGEIADYVGPGLTEVLYRKTTGPIRSRRTSAADHGTAVRARRRRRGAAGAVHHIRG